LNVLIYELHEVKLPRGFYKLHKVKLVHKLSQHHFSTLQALLNIDNPLILRTSESQRNILLFQHEFAIYQHIIFSGIVLLFAYPLMYLIERFFGFTSNVTLVELSNVNRELLRKLSEEAPGTFQHSMQVSNLAAEVALKIGAKSQLVRTGALYHDIGKMQNPLCFVENESMLAREGQARYHDGLTPVQSAQDIIRHVSDGLELADKGRLPKIVKDFILTHHGTGCVSYFYTKYLNDGGDPSEQASFCYPGNKPVSREQVILMLCDSVEAASRTLVDYSPETFDRFVEGIVAGKVAEDQFSEAEISVKDLTLVKAALKSYLAQMYHERIAYPKRNKQ
jgi:putative nucleotidyltransferase with HDIG domain